MTPIDYCVCLMWTLAAAGMAWYIGTVAQQITYVTLADGRRKARNIPLTFRILLPLTPNFDPLFMRPGFARMRVKTDRHLVAAGFEDLLTGAELLALRLLLPMTFGVLWIAAIFVLLRQFPVEFLVKMAPGLYVIGPLYLLGFPGFWLAAELKKRHRSIRRSLPFVLDILTLSVEAGMDFMTALQRHIERSTIDDLDEELIRVIREIQLGKTRREALRDMSERVNSPDLKSVVNALVQADELGVSIGSILRIQSEQIRQRRFERAERLANEAPVKMLAPLLLFIFPAVFLVLLAPIIVQLLQQGI